MSFLKVKTFTMSDQKNKGKTLHHCEWIGCEGSEERPRKPHHIKEPKYPGNGNLDRGELDIDNPWEIHGPGQNSHATIDDYADQFSDNAKDKWKFAGSAFYKHSYPVYPTQKHHLISIELFDNYPDLSDNAKLIGYDVNRSKNGLALPTYIVDIVQHDLQSHNGSHSKDLYSNNPDYGDSIDTRLSKLDADCVDYCKSDHKGKGKRQKRLIEDLDRISDRAKYAIRVWRWLLRPNALKERELSETMLADKIRSGQTG